MEWIKLEVVTTNEASEAAANILMENGAGGVQFDDERSDDNVALITYFQENEASPELVQELTVKIQALSDFGLNPGPATVTIETTNDDKWATAWEKYYRPVRLTRYLTVVPSWTDYQASQADEKIMRLDPGKAFGTGTHPTTKLSLQALETVMRGGEVVLDVGTGSGVLSIAAKLFGAGEIYATDVDDEAVKSAQKNLDLNPVAKNVHVQVSDLLKGIDIQADLMLANILPDVLVRLIPEAPKNLKPGGLLITSGIITAKRDLILTTMQDAGFEILQTLNEGDWHAIIGRLKTEEN
ncbi:50S ribosomal protein L11 methyltransferase [Ligilactobacillus equi]|nr:50S ribosomal protein L11 methyltransferase [Ligilactobacillus equi]KRL81326.1 ribosomal protein L11 methyltransferase [Ligilactobacillus equi DSM 15833 = JCM 10991]